MMIHSFRRYRPGAVRGYSWLTPALPIFAQLRAYCESVMSAAHTAAIFAAVIETDMLPDEDPAAAEREMSQIDTERAQLTFLPSRYKINQLRAEQPVQTYDAFVREKIKEAVRCICMPYLAAGGDASQHNYASGRLDLQSYRKFVGIMQVRIVRRVLNRLLAEWWSETGLAGGVGGAVPAHQWMWDGHEHVDPMKEAAARDTNLRNLSITHAEIYASAGKDWRDQYRQAAAEKALRQELGLSIGDMSNGSNQDNEEDRGDDAADAER